MAVRSAVRRVFMRRSKTEDQVITRNQLLWTLTPASLMVVVLVSLTACSTRTEPMSDSELNEFATRYAAAWSGQNPETLASFYAKDGSLTVNAGPPSVGRAAITAKASEFMTAFPDMVVRMDSVSRNGDQAIFHWTWTGTNTGPGGTGRSVRISGYEEWTFGAAGLIAESQGHFDEAEYERQMSGGGDKD
jgi:uncharacterized protein (TIGR02246 family)